MSARLIINADDFGYEPEVTRGIRAAMREGVVTSTTMMVNTPFSEAAAGDAAGLSVGLHLNLARWAAVSDGRALDERTVAGLPVAFVRDEALAQLDRLSALLGRDATHVDVHKHLHTHANVLEGLAQAAKARDLPVRSISETMRAALRAFGVRTNDHFVGDAGATAYWTEAQLEADLAAMPTSGLVELMCHPGHTPVALTSGYGAQREVELATFTSARATALMGALHVGRWRDAR